MVERLGNDVPCMAAGMPSIHSRSPFLLPRSQPSLCAVVGSFGILHLGARDFGRHPDLVI